ncbi:arginine--tRNA ligase [Candidatus Saccharibacteria bacterium]|nr:arginine--tRNA ligase [Candidatus Saccharibacteria bacterium]
MIETEVKNIITEAIDSDVEIELARPKPTFGDFSTNIAMKLAKKLGKNPRQIAEEISESISEHQDIVSAEVAGPGFINIKIADNLIIRELLNNLENPEDYGTNDVYKNQLVLTEYSDPNPFKELHVGHLYTTIIGDGVSNLISAGGGDVHKINFGGDVGMHVAKAVWAIIQWLGSEESEDLQSVNEDQRPSWLSARYVAGAKAFEDGKKEEIKAINKRIYKIIDEKDTDSELAKIYWTCRTWSYNYFKNFYKQLDTEFEKFYPESENSKLGLDTVRAHVGDVYQESDGAVIFDGEKHGLHTRVFINKEGLPTYEAKDIGLALARTKDYNPDKTIIITGNDIEEYMKVVLKSLEQFEPEIARNTQHITHGQVKMKGGIKMSSRLGNVLSASDVIDAVRQIAKIKQPDSKVDSTFAAIKYAFLRQKIGPDVILDPEESVSLEGKSGPYLQYAYARSKSILAQSGKKEFSANISDLESAERSLAVKITQYPSVVEEAVGSLEPHGIALYLHALAQEFNRFYEHNRVIDDQRSQTRLAILSAYSIVLKNGLDLLNIEAPERI